MDNQQNQADGLMPGDDVRVQNAGSTTGSTGLGNEALATGVAADAPRKAGSARGARNTASSPSADDSSANKPGTPQAGRDENAGSEQPENLVDSALQSGKKWIEDSGLLGSVNQLPQTLKDFGSRTAARVSDLSTTQKVVGGALLAMGLGWLATRKSNPSKSKSAGAKTGSGYGRANSGYKQQTPNSFASRRPGVGPLGRPDNDSPFSNTNSGRYGNGGIFSGGASEQASTRTASRYGDHGNAATGDHNSRTSESSYRKSNNFGGNE